MDSGSKQHWENIYATKPADRVSWYQNYPHLSMKLISSSGIDAGAQLIDVGGGASVLVDALLDAGYSRLTVLDISAKALEVAQRRLANRAALVNWLEADVTQVELPAHSYDLWHDRAVFHFLTQPQQRQSYLAVLRHATKSGSQILMATFAPDGPTHCSNLEVVRYSAESLQAELGTEFSLLESQQEAHQTPFETVQQFQYCRFVRT